jgi:hypothetical protein
VINVDTGSGDVSVKFVDELPSSAPTTCAFDSGIFDPQLASSLGSGTMSHYDQAELELCSANNWAINFVTSSFDIDANVTTFVYMVSNPGSIPNGSSEHISRVTIGWSGMCCLKSAHYFNDDIFSANPDLMTGVSGLSFPMSWETFSDRPLNKTVGEKYSLSFNGKHEAVRGASMVSIAGKDGFCLYSVVGPDCTACTCSSSAASTTQPLTLSSPIVNTSTSSVGDSQMIVPSSGPSTVGGCDTCTIIDFETDSTGKKLTSADYIQSQWLEVFGITITAFAKTGGHTPGDKARIYDSSTKSGPLLDTDLGSPNEACPFGGPGKGAGGAPGSLGQNCDPVGNVLIIQDADKLAADANEAGGTITFDFADPVRFGHIGLMDMDEGGSYIDVVTSEGLTHTVNFFGAGDNSVQKVVVDMNHVVSVVVHFTNAAAITELSVCFDCPADCGVAEEPSSCSNGDFGIENVVITSYDSDTVSFILNSNSSLSHVQVWFENVDQAMSQFYCSSKTSVSAGAAIGSYTAKCTDNRALLLISGSSEAGLQQLGGLSIEDPMCQSNFEFIPFNPMKRCLWQISLPCSSTCDSSKRELHEQDENIPCEIKSKLDGVKRVNIDKCIAMPTEVDPVQIISQDTDTVTFALHQVWKGCESGGSELGWIATDFIATDGVLHCDRQPQLSCGLVREYTASCTGGKAVVDLYAFDEERGILGQADGSTLVVPTACESGDDDASKICHFRFVLDCEASPCLDELEKDVLPRHLGNDHLVVKEQVVKPRNRYSIFDYFF